MWKMSLLNSPANGADPQGQDEILRRLLAIIILVLFGLSVSFGCSSEYQAGPNQPQADNSAGKRPVSNVAQVQTSYENISPEEVKDKMDAKEDFLIVDVRPRPFYDAGHIPGAISMPLKEFWRKSNRLDSTMEIVLYCQVGITSVSATEMLIQFGFTNVKNMLGGIEQWKYGLEVADFGTII